MILVLLVYVSIVSMIVHAKLAKIPIITFDAVYTNLISHLCIITRLVADDQHVEEELTGQMMVSLFQIRHGQK